MNPRAAMVARPSAMPSHGVWMNWLRSGDFEIKRFSLWVSAGFVFGMIIGVEERCPAPSLTRILYLPGRGAGAWSLPSLSLFSERIFSPASFSIVTREPEAGLLSWKKTSIWIWLFLRRASTPMACANANVGNKENNKITGNNKRKCKDQTPWLKRNNAQSIYLPSVTI